MKHSDIFELQRLLSLAYLTLDKKKEYSVECPPHREGLPHTVAQSP